MGLSGLVEKIKHFSLSYKLIFFIFLNLNFVSSAAFADLWAQPQAVEFGKVQVNQQVSRAILLSNHGNEEIWGIHFSTNCKITKFRSACTGWLTAGESCHIFADFKSPVSAEEFCLFQISAWSEFVRISIHGVAE